MSGPPIFVVGAARSGTTLLRRLLNRHPDLHLTFEASFFNVASAVPAGTSDARFRARWTGSLPFAWQRVPDDALDIAAPLGLHARDPAYFRALMAWCARREGKPRFGDKSPLHINAVGPLLAAFPDARVVHIVRDPVAVVRSLNAVPWAPASLVANALSVRAGLDAVQPFRDRIHEVRLEDLLADRPATMRRLLDFCDLPWSDQVIGGTDLADDAPPVPWLATRDRDRNRLPQRPELAAEDAYRISRITAPQRARYGYAPLPPAGRSLGGHLSRAFVDLQELGTLLRLLWHLRRTLRRQPQPAPAEVFDAVNTLHPDAVLACSPADRDRLVTWLSEGRESG